MKSSYAQKFSVLNKIFINPTFHLVLANLYKAACILLINKAAATKLNPEAYGIFGQFLSISAVFNMLSSIGLGSAIIRDISSNPEESTVIARNYLRICISVSLFLMVLGIALSIPLDKMIFHKSSLVAEMLALSLAIPLLSVSNFFSYYYSGIGRQSRSAYIQFISLTLGMAILMILTLNFGDIRSFIFSYIVFLCLPAVSFLLTDSTRPVKLGLKRSDIRFFIGDTLSMFGAFLILPLTNIGLRSDLAASHGWSAVASLQVVTRLSDAYMQIFGIYFSNNILPNFSRGKSFMQLVKKQIPRLALAMIAFGIIIIPFYNYIVTLLFSIEYTNTISIFLMQYVGDFVKIFILIFSYFYLSRKMFRSFIILELVQGFLLAIIYKSSNFLGIGQGEQAAVGAYVITMIITIVLVVTVHSKCPFGKERNENTLSSQ